MAYPFQPLTRNHTLKKFYKLRRQSWERKETNCSKKESVPHKFIPPETNHLRQDQVLNHQ